MAIRNGLVEEFFNTPIPLEVWHYTTLAGFEGILSSGTIWATEAHFTNDNTEFVHARKVATDFLNAINPTDAHAEYAKEAGLEMVNSAFDRGVLSTDQMEIYVASFSAAADLKSQWSEYADNSHGVSLAFDLSKVRPPQSLKFGITMAPCVYLENEKERLIESGLGHFIDAVARLHGQTSDPQWVAGQMNKSKIIEGVYGRDFNRSAFEKNLQNQFSAQLHEAHTKSSFDLLRLASHCKDSSFRQEEEWRLALPRFKNKPLTHGEILYRGVRKNIPYFPSNLFQERLPITRVMTGPFCGEVEKIQKILDSHGYSVPISKSAIPLRNPGEAK